MADVGCGLGWSAIGIALAYPDATVDGYDVDGPSIEAARRNAREAGVDDRVRFHAVDAATVDGESYDAVFAFECIHDLPDPVGVLAAMRRLAGDAGAVVVMDERVAETFTAPGDDVERLMYGYSLVCCLADGMAHAAVGGHRNGDAALDAAPLRRRGGVRRRRDPRHRQRLLPLLPPALTGSDGPGPPGGLQHGGHAATGMEQGHPAAIPRPPGLVGGFTARHTGNTAA